MRTLDRILLENEASSTKEPLYILRVSFDNDDTDHVAFTSHDRALTLSGDVGIRNVLRGCSGQTQKINPDIAASTIGGVTFELVDLEDRRENLQNYSEAMDRKNLYNTTVTVDQEKAPDQSYTMDLVIPTVTNIEHDIEVSISPRPFGQTDVMSIYAKAAGYNYIELCWWNPTDGYHGSTVFNIATGVVESGNGSITHIGSGIYRCSNDDGGGLHTVLFGNVASFGVRATAGARVFAGDGTSGVLMWGMQRNSVRLEQYTKTGGMGEFQPATVTLTEAPRVTEQFNTKLEAGDGLRGKLARLYVGYDGMTADEYDLRLTYIIDSVDYKDGIYTISATDIQRHARAKILDPDTSNLVASITETDTIIKVNEVALGRFQAVAHGAEWTDYPSQSIGYVKIEDEVIAHTGLVFDTTYGYHLPVIERGALGTRAVPHAIDEAKTLSKRRKITEHIFMEGPAPKIIYALLTGTLLNGSSPEDTLPDHWHLGISTSHVRLTDFQTIGPDLWNTTDDSGRFVRIENPGGGDGKKFIEKELLLWMGCYMPVYTTGELGLRNLSKVLADSGYSRQLDEGNVISYSSMKHDMRSVINDIRIEWNYVDSIDAFTKLSLLVDAGSIATHNVADEKTFKFKAVHTGLHTDEDIVQYFDVIRDRYSGPPLRMSLVALPSNMMLEVGDTVRVSLENVRDYNTNESLDRVFEIQQITTNWMTGALKFSLFASSQAAGALSPTELSSVMNDSWYTSEGTSLDSSDSPAGPLTIVAGTVTANGTITGSTVGMDSAIFYYDGDLTIGAGVTVTITENVQLRIKGSLQINGKIDGAGQGPTGGAATTQYTDATTKDSFSIYTGEGKVNYDVDTGDAGAMGITSPAGGYEILLGGWPEMVWPDPQMQQFGYQAMPYPTLKNPDGNSLTGYPQQLFGMSGAGGMPVILRTGYDVGFTQIEGNGGAGGDGGAGLMIVARGMAFGASGEIDLSGTASSVGGSFVTGGLTFRGGSGAPGAPGGLLVLMDGDYTNPDLTATHVTLDYGDSTVPSASPAVSVLGPADLAVEKSLGTHWLTSWQYADSIVDAGYLAARTGPMLEAAQRVVYIPEQSEPVLDDTNFPTQSDALYKDKQIVGRQAAPASTDLYGFDMDINRDESRTVISGGIDLLGSTGEYIQILRGQQDMALEQEITTPFSGTQLFGFQVRIDEAGDRVLVTAPNMEGTDSPPTSNCGRVLVYSRSGVTWSLEATLSLAAPSAGTQLGAEVDMDQSGTHIIANDLTNNGARYWNRSGTSWTDRGNLPLPAGYDATGYGRLPLSLTGSAIAMAAVGDYAIVTDQARTVDGTADTGAAYIFSRDGNTWTQIGANLSPRTGAAWKWGQAAAMSKDGVAFVISSQENIGSVYGAVAVYQRQGENSKLIQIIDGAYTASPGGIFGNVVKMSDDGMTLIIYDDTETVARFYTRSSTNQEFLLKQTFDNKDAGTWSGDEKFNISPDGDVILAASRSATYGGVATAGMMRVLEYNPSPVD